MLVLMSMLMSNASLNFFVLSLFRNKNVQFRIIFSLQYSIYKRQLHTGQLRLNFTGGVKPKYIMLIIFLVGNIYDSNKTAPIL